MLILKNSLPQIQVAAEAAASYPNHMYTYRKVCIVFFFLSILGLSIILTIVAAVREGHRRQGHSNKFNKR
jgi:hypothetical protein